ncbi:RNA-binding (RRM/RBD/RNP motifs) family protein [Wolffia australiana]
MAASSAASFLLLLPSSSSSAATRVLLPVVGPRALAGAVSSPARAISLVYSARNRGLALVPRVLASPSVDTEEELSGEDEEQPNFSPDLKLFVGNLPFSVDSAQLAEIFSNAGTVEMVEVIYDKLTGKSRGFGFVTMSSVEEVEAAVDMFSGYEIQGRPLRVNSGPPPSKDGPPQRRFNNGPPRGSDSGNRIFVGNLSWSVDDQSLQSFFSEAGRVVDARVVIDRDTGRSKGFGFVTFNSDDAAESAVSSFNGADLDGRSIRVTIAEARQRRQF